MGNVLIFVVMREAYGVFVAELYLVHAFDEALAQRD